MLYAALFTVLLLLFVLSIRRYLRRRIFGGGARH